jgi:hypothetical protein
VQGQTATKQPPFASISAAPVVFRRFNASSAAGPQECLSFDVSFLLVNLSAPALDSGHRRALVHTIAAVINESASAVELRGAGTGTGASPAKMQSYSLQQAANITVVLSDHSHSHSLLLGGPAGLASSLYLALELAVYSGSATALFRRELAAQSVREATLPAIVAVMPSSSSSSPVPSQSPSLEPLVGSVDRSRANSGSSALLTAGIVSGVLALVCLAVPLAYLMRRNFLKKKCEAEDQDRKLQSKDSKELSRSKDMGLRSLGSDESSIVAFGTVYSNEVMLQSLSGEVSLFESFTGPSMSEIFVQGRGRRRKHKVEDVTI